MLVQCRIYDVVHFVLRYGDDDGLASPVCLSCGLSFPPLDDQFGFRIKYSSILGLIFFIL